MRAHKHRWYDIVNYLNPLFKTIRFGQDNSNYTELDEEGIYLKGTSKVWEDIQASLIAKRIDLAAGTVSYNYNNNTLTFSPSGSISNSSDRVMWNIQKPHSASIEGLLNVHIHWEQIDSADREFTLQYRIQANGEAMTSAWTNVVSNTNMNNKYVYTSGTLNQITELVSIDTSEYGLSSIIQFRLTRSDSVAGDIEALFVDAHYEKDTMGSREEYTK